MFEYYEWKVVGEVQYVQVFKRIGILIENILFENFSRKKLIKKKVILLCFCTFLQILAHCRLTVQDSRYLHTAG